jgi:uncharacterized protein YjbI with pentapeptide repeats
VVRPVPRVPTHGSRNPARPRHHRRLVATGVATLVLAGAAVTACQSGGAVIGACPIRHGADCEGNYMARANLENADLYDANLAHADLSDADLTGADLHGADLHGANLARAKLAGAQLAYANLGGADLTDADLTGAVLTATDLFGIRYSTLPWDDAYLCATILPDGTLANPGCIP